MRGAKCLRFCFFTEFSNFRIDWGHFEGGRCGRGVARPFLVHDADQRLEHLAVRRHIDVLPEQVQHQEVSDLDPADQVLDLGRARRPEATLQDGFARRRHHHDGGRVQDRQAGQHRQDDEPEPVGKN